MKINFLYDYGRCKHHESLCIWSCRLELSNMINYFCLIIYSIDVYLSGVRHILSTGYMTKNKAPSLPLYFNWETDNTYKMQWG